MSPRKRSFFRVNRWQNIAASLRLHPRLLSVLSTKHARSKPPARKLVLVQPVIWPPPLRAAAASPAGSLADCPAGSWPMPVLKPKERQWENLRERRKLLPPLATQGPDRRRKPQKMRPNRPAMTLN